MKNHLNKHNRLGLAGISLIAASMFYMTGCSGKGGSGDGDGTSTSSCSTPLEASLSIGSDRIGGATSSVELVSANDINYTLYNVANELRVSTVAGPDPLIAGESGLEVAGYINDIETVDYNGSSYALLAMGEEGISVVDISTLPTMTIVQDSIKVSYSRNNITIAEGSGELADINISSSRAPISSLAVYNEGNNTVPNWQLVIGDEGYGLHKTSLSNLISGTLDGNGTLLIDGPEKYTLQYAGENPWGGPKSLTVVGDGNDTKLFVAQGFLGMGIYNIDLNKTGRYNHYTDTNASIEDWFDYNVEDVVQKPLATYLDICTGMPNYEQASWEIIKVNMEKNTTVDTPWADFETLGKYYYDARKVDVATFGGKTIAYIAYGNGGLVAVDVTGYENADARSEDCQIQNNFLEATYLGYVPAIPVHGPEDVTIGGSDSVFSRAGAGMLKDAGVVDVKVDTALEKVFYTDHFGGLMVVDKASTPNLDWHGPAGFDAYNNDDDGIPDNYIPTYEFVTSYDMNTSITDDEALPDYTMESPILLATSEVGGHGNSLALTGNGFDLNDIAPADVVMAAGAGGLNFIEVFEKLVAPDFNGQYDFNVTEHFATTDEIGAAPDGFEAPEISVGHSAGVGTYDNILYLADAPHGMMAWKVADIVGGNCQNIPTDQVRLVGNTLQSESVVGEINPTPHADEVVVISDGVTKSAMVASLSAGLRRVNVNNMGTEGAPELLYPTAGDIYEHSIEETKLAGLSLEDRVYDVAVRGNLAFTADGLSGVTVYDLDQVPDGSNDAIVVGNIKKDGNKTINNATGIELSGDHAFVAGGATGIAVIDISDPSNLSIVKSFQPIKWEDIELDPKAHNADGIAVDVKIMGQYAFFTYDSFGVLAYRISDLIDPNYENPDDIRRPGAESQNRPNAVGYFKMQNPNTYTTSLITDFSDWSGGASGIDAITTTDGKRLVYVAYGDAGVVKLDWSNLWTQTPASIYEPIAPVLEDHLNTAGSANDVSVWYGRVYVADGAGGLVLVK